MKFIFTTRVCPTLGASTLKPENTPGRYMGRTRPRGYLDSYVPNRASRELLNCVEMVLEEYRDQLPLTCRQIFYRLVGRYSYEKTEKAYHRLTELLVKARRARLIPFDQIRDDGATVLTPNLYDSADEWLHTIKWRASRFRLSPWLK